MSSRLMLLLVLAALLPASVACRATGPAPGHAGLPVFAESGWNRLALDDDEEAPVEEIDEVEEADEGHGVLHHVLLYIPNRIFDVFDVVRARVRLGPGIQVGVRATDAIDVNLGTYAAVWVGLHGPRLEPAIPWPVGLETFTGAEISVAEASIEGGVQYGPVEFGAGFQALLVGVDIGVEPLELLDLVTGFVFIDLVGDDY